MLPRALARHLATRSSVKKAFHPESVVLFPSVLTASIGELPLLHTNETLEVWNGVTCVVFRLTNRSVVSESFTEFGKSMMEKKKTRSLR